MPPLWEVARRYADQAERLVVGLMSGTSVDGVDTALVRVAGAGQSTQADLLAFVTLPFPAAVREAVLALSHGEGNAQSVSHLNVVLGHLFADAVQAVLGELGTKAVAIDAVASHGQTVSHTAPGAVPSPPNPPSLPPGPPSLGGVGPVGRDSGAGQVTEERDEHSSPPKLEGPAGRLGGLGGIGATLQIGEPAVIAQRFNVVVVSDFRAADVAAGGQGAPLVPYADWCLLTHPAKSRCVQNIGGIGNVTFLPAGAAPQQVLGFDTGPGNMLLDRAAFWATNGQLSFDRDGALAATGRADNALLARLLGHAFLERRPPKSAGREEFGEAFWQTLRQTAEHRRLAPADLAATLTAFTARSIANAYQRFLPFLPDEVIVGGGGARNLALMELLREMLAPIPVMAHEAVGINGDAKEAVAFALLANETLLGNPSNLPSVTGASRPVVLGKITVP